MAAQVGFEPTHNGVRVHRLTAWLLGSIGYGWRNSQSIIPHSAQAVKRELFHACCVYVFRYFILSRQERPILKCLSNASSASSLSFRTKDACIRHTFAKKAAADKFFVVKGSALCYYESYHNGWIWHPSASRRKEYETVEALCCNGTEPGHAVWPDGAACFCRI